MARSKRKLTEDQELFRSDFRSVLDTREGRAVLRWIVFELGRYNTSSFDLSAEVSAFREGHRDVALQVLRMAALVDARAALTLLVESIEPKESDNESADDDE